MPEQNNPTILRWDIPEFIEYERSLLWYVIAIVVGVAMIAYAVFTSNFLFAIIIVLIATVMVISSFRPRKTVKFEISPTGIRFDAKKFNYNQFKNFAIVYQPPQVNTLYLEFKMPFKERLSIPMGDINPNRVRDYLLNFVEEDLERDEESLSDILGRILRL